MEPQNNHSTSHFNSHAHVERDWEIKNYPHAPFISTHTLTWSVTAAEVIREQRRMISTHTLTWSVTQNLLAHINNVFISTHTLTWSVTR